VDELIGELKQVVLEETQVQITDEDLQKRAAQYPLGSDQDKFHYACGLIQHPDKTNKEKGVQLLRALYSAIQKTSKYFSDADKDLARACLYYIAIGYFVMRNYKSTREYGKILLDVTPNHQNCKALLALVDEMEGADSITTTSGSKDKKKGGLFSFKTRKDKKDDKEDDRKKDKKDEKKDDKKDEKKDEKKDDKKDEKKDDKKEVKKEAKKEDELDKKSITEKSAQKPKKESESTGDASEDKQKEPSKDDTSEANEDDDKGDKDNEQNNSDNNEEGDEQDDNDEDENEEEKEDSSWYNSNTKSHVFIDNYKNSQLVFKEPFGYFGSKECTEVSEVQQYFFRFASSNLESDFVFE